MTAIGSAIPMNALLFGQFDPRPAHAGQGQAQTMVEKFAAYSDLRAAITASSTVQGEADAVAKNGKKANTQGTLDIRPDQGVAKNTPSQLTSVTAMSTDNRFALLALQEFQASSSAEQDVPATSSDAAAEFLEYAAKTPAERYYETLLQSMGLTKEGLAQLPPEERTKVERMIQDKMRQHMEASMTENPA